MKHIILKLVVLTSVLIACKDETTKIDGAKKNESISVKDDLEQAPLLLKNKNGEQIKITYFAKDEEIGVRLRVNEEERELEAKGSNEIGNPVFSDGEYGWEMFTDGRSGRLFTKDSEGQLFRER